MKILKFFKSLPFFNSSNKSLKSSEIITTLATEVEPHKFFDCVMMETKYESLQEEIKKSSISSFDPVVDVGVIIGCSTTTNSNGLPSYYVVGWVNPEEPNQPVVSKQDHWDIVGILRPMGEIDDRNKHLNRMFEAFFSVWLQKFDHNLEVKN